MTAVRLIHKIPAIWIGFLLGLSSAFAAPEPWTDARLPVKDGLELWLDAGRQNSARQARQLPALANGRPIDVWFDGSGLQRDVTQRIPDARPRFSGATNGGYLHFDGKDDSLAASNIRGVLTNASIFATAAPRSNAGGFRGLLGFSQTGRNDYQSGLNFDLGPMPSGALSVINVEGQGFEGARNLLSNSTPFRAFHVLELLCDSSSVRFFMDAKLQGQRERTPALLHMDELTIGARFYSNTPEPPHTQGFFNGDIAEVIIFNRALPEKERAAVERYLTEKHAGLRSSSEEQNLPGGLRSLETVVNPPPVQIFVPGFAVRELPVSLSNINNVKYRPDGKLVALAYNGRIYLLSDTDGDGLEDKAELFWDRDTLRAPIGMALSPPGYPRGDGLFIAAKGKLALILDRDRDGRADEEIVVASGWKELFHGVDALGVALDTQGNIFFGLGCANFTDAYLIDKATGKSRYDLASERGTILKVSPDFSKREIFCTGIRFPVALAFNRDGDLFSTDQEGATWLPNGNPFDELLHIQQGRHYGFPPRHPKHLPNVIDDPSVFDYTPQHQSTCGLNFNEPVYNGPIFGPSWWAGDAIVSGYSRGKLFRTKVFKSETGYIAQNQQIASLNMLPADACVSPQGDLVVATHSGSPDWGSGPEGKGKLYKVSYANRELPQPVLAWSASPSEMRIAFDRPIDLTQLKEIAKRASITRGEFVSAGDRFESLRPGYQAVQDQLAAPRFDVPIHSVLLSSDRRSLLVRTPPQSAAENYALSLPRFGGSNPSRSLPQHNVMELATDLNGVEAVWQSRSGQDEERRVWLPHLDLQAARAFTVGSAEHQAFWTLLKKPGQLTLRCQIDLWQMLQPALQPGTHLDYTPPVEKVQVDLSASIPATFASGSERTTGQRSQKLSRLSKKDEWMPLEIALPTGDSEPQLQITWHTEEDPRPRALPLRRFFLPWAKPGATNLPGMNERTIPEIAGGNWLHGKRIFFSDRIGCYKCHRVRSEGGKIGPDLSNLVFRDYGSVLRDITAPNETINPEHLAYNAELKNGDTTAGVLLSDKADEIILGVVSGESVHLAKKEIASLKPSTLSLMPEGLLQSLSPQETKDLMTFLLSSPLDPAALEATGEPPARSQAELSALLKQTPTPVSTPKPLHILLSAGPKDHGPGEHDYPLWLKRWEKLLRLADSVEVNTTFGWPKVEQFQKSDVIVLYSDNPGWSAEHAPELDAFLNRGGGLVLLHYAVDGRQHATEFSERIGLAWRGGASKFRHGPLDLKLGDHPLATGLGKLNLVDESYWQLIGDEKKIQLIATGVEEGKPRPLIWTREQGRGRVFVSIPGHYTWTFDDPLFRILILRGICWSAHEPMDRLSELATVGTRLRD